MPCQYCKSKTHSVRNCEEDANEYVCTVISRMLSMNWKLRDQQQMLMKESKGKLAMICRVINYRFSGDKFQLSWDIVSWLALSTEISVNEADKRTLMTEYCEATVTNCFTAVNILENVYYRIHRILRHPGESVERYLARIYLEADPDEDEVEQVDGKAIEKRIVIEGKRGERIVQECGICYEEKVMLKLSCDHAFCVDCINGCFKSNNSSCAFCRSEITALTGPKEILRNLQSMMA
jgi:hypothetical protein